MTVDDHARSAEPALGAVLIAAEDLGLTPERERFLAPRLRALLADLRQLEELESWTIGPAMTDLLGGYDHDER